MPGAPIARAPEATEVFSCTFGASSDRNFDLWPDQWTRRKGPGFPHYVEVKIVEERAPSGSRCLRIDLDGGGAVAYSPPIAFNPAVDWQLEGLAKTQGLRHDEAFMSLVLLDEHQRPLGSLETEKLRGTQPWSPVRLGPIAAVNPQTRFVSIGLHLQPAAGGPAADLKGSAWFTDIWLGRMPRVTLSTGRPLNLVNTKDRLAVTCTATGFPEGKLEAEFALDDGHGQLLAQVRRPMRAVAAAATAQPATMEGSLPVAAAGPSAGGASDGSAEASWEPPVPGPGFYRVTATVRRSNGVVYRRGQTLAVIEPQAGMAEGEFGWSLPRGEQPFALPVLAQVISQAGIHWVKYPVWFGGSDVPGQLDAFVAFHERLALTGVEVVGMLTRPAQEASPNTPPTEGGAALQVADVFSAGEKSWSGALEPIMARLGPRIRWWQLGRDDDTSFVDYPQLTTKLAAIKAQLQRLGQDVNLGLGWGWLNPSPAAGLDGAACQFLTLTADPPLAPTELADYLDAPPSPGIQRWVVLEPLPQAQYDVETRAVDLVQRMIAAKIHKAEGIFVADPFDPDCGLISDDGTLGELFLPWRTTAALLGAASYRGTLPLPAGSPNQVFVRGSEAVIVAWSDRPRRERLNLGEGVRQIDLWGHVHALAADAQGQSFTTGPLPTFIVGASAALVRWRMEFKLKQDHVPSVFGQVYENGCRWKNTFDQQVSGRAEIVPPKNWNVEPRQITFRLGPGEEFQQPLQILLPNNVTGGTHQLRADFEVQADRGYRFSAVRNIEVGSRDVFIETATRLKPDGFLEVEQRFFNETTEHVTFRCQLFAANRQRQKVDIVGLKPGHSVHVYRLPEGMDLVGGQLWIRAEEIGGPRVLNYRFPAEP